MKSVPDKLRVSGTGSGRAVPSGGRGRRFKSSHPDHLFLLFQCPVTVVPDCISQEFLSHYIDEPSEELLTLDITHALAHLLHGVNTEAVTPMLVTFSSCPRASK